MLVKEEFLAAFRRCPKALWLTQKSHSSNEVGGLLKGCGINDPVQTITRWMWAQELRTGNKVTLRSAKHKWGQVVTS